MGPSARILVVDAVGTVFDRLQALKLPAQLSRVPDPHTFTPDRAPTLIVFAAYGPITDWAGLEELCVCAPTLIITTTYRTSDVAAALHRCPFGYLDAHLPQPTFHQALQDALLQGEPAFSRRRDGAETH